MSEQSDHRDVISDITVILSIEIPFWIPIESGEYPLNNERSVKLRNDFWLVSVRNIIDGPLDRPFEFIFNEAQVTDHDFLERLSGKSAKYYHKQKMRTVFTRGFLITPAEGTLTAQPGTEAWEKQLNQVVFNLISIDEYHEFLDDINSFVDHYCALISTSNPTREVRHVSFYETVVRIQVHTLIEGTMFMYLTRAAPDFAMSGIPYPSLRVRKKGDSGIFKETILNSESPVFHQLQWARASNHYRENRYQEALLSAAITLEALTHQYLMAKGLSSKRKRNAEIKGKKGQAGWIQNLKITTLADECEDVAELWLLRNDVVHDQRMLLEEEREIVTKGIQSLRKVRTHMLGTINPTLLKSEEKFSSFLEPIPIGTRAGQTIKELFPMKLEWRREVDHYQTSVEMQSKPEDFDL